VRRKGQLDDPAMADHCRLILAQSHARLGEPEAALEHYTRLVDDAREAGNHPMVAQGLTEAGQLLFQLGRPEEATKRLHEAAVVGW
jgi:tetratricopeptide (TPR) repeat protein